MANPTSFTFENDQFTFKNGQIEIVADTQGTLPGPITVEQVTITTPHDHAVILPITDVVVPPPVLEHVPAIPHVFDLLV
jgi:hypothetical protein